MKDPSFESYIEAIEKHLRARRGAEHILSPRDFALARSWYEAGVPLATVLVGVDRAFETGDVTSLAYARRRVEELSFSGPLPEARPSPAAESIPLKDVGEILQALLERLSRLRPGPAACFEPPLRKIREIQDLLAVTTRPNWDYLRGKLREIDDDVSASLFSALSAEDLEGCHAEAEKAVARHRGRVDEDALMDAKSRYVVQRARERLGLPRVSLV
jgi:hypothetical protein